MRILDDDSDKKLDGVLIFLTRSELQELLSGVKQLLENTCGDHIHISSADYQKEITLCIYEPGKTENFSPRCQKLILEDE